MFPLLPPPVASRPPQTAPGNVSATESPPGSTTFTFDVDEPAPIYPSLTLRLEILSAPGTYTHLQDFSTPFVAQGTYEETWAAVVSEVSTFALSFLNPNGQQGPRALLIVEPSGGGALAAPSTAVGVPTVHQATVTPAEPSTLTRVVLEVYEGGEITAYETTFTSDGSMTQQVISHPDTLPLFGAYARHEDGADVSGWG